MKREEAVQAEHHMDALRAMAAQMRQLAGQDLHEAIRFEDENVPELLLELFHLQDRMASYFAFALDSLPTLDSSHQIAAWWRFKFFIALRRKTPRKVVWREVMKWWRARYNRHADILLNQYYDNADEALKIAEHIFCRAAIVQRKNPTVWVGETAGELAEVVLVRPESAKTYVLGHEYYIKLRDDMRCIQASGTGASAREAYRVAWRNYREQVRILG